jgi:hypothetical protein
MFLSTTADLSAMAWLLPMKTPYMRSLSGHCTKPMPSTTSLDGRVVAARVRGEVLLAVDLLPQPRVLLVVRARLHVVLVHVSQRAVQQLHGHLVELELVLLRQLGGLARRLHGQRHHQFTLLLLVWCRQIQLESDGEGDAGDGDSPRDATSNEHTAEGGGDTARRHRAMGLQAGVHDGRWTRSSRGDDSCFAGVGRGPFRQKWVIF